MPEDELEDDGELADRRDAARPFVYLFSGLGSLVAVVAMLVDQGADFSFAAIFVAPLLAIPYLVYARLAMQRPGPEAVVAGVVVLTVGTWASITATGGLGRYVGIAVALTLVELATFAAAALLRPTVGPPGRTAAMARHRRPADGAGRPTGTV